MKILKKSGGPYKFRNHCTQTSKRCPGRRTRQDALSKIILSEIFIGLSLLILDLINRTLTESEIQQSTLENVNYEQEKLKFSNEHTGSATTRLDSYSELQQHVQQSAPSKTNPNKPSIEESEAIRSIKHSPCQRKQNCRNVLLITPKTSEVDVFSKIEESNNINFRLLGVLKKVNLRHSSVLLECNSEKQVDTLRKIISEFQELNVEPTNFCGHIVSINDLSREVTREEINSIIFAKYKEFPNDINFVPYAPGWKEDVNIALIDVSDSLLTQIEKYPKISIHWIEYTINVLLKISNELKGWNLDNFSSYREMNNHTRNSIKITNISKFSVAGKNTARRDIIITDYRHKVDMTKTWTELTVSSLEHGSFGQSKNENIVDKKSDVSQNQEISEASDEYVQEILAKILPSALQYILKIVDESIDNTLAALLPRSSAHNTLSSEPVSPS